MTTFSYIWEFIVRPEHLKAFEVAYGRYGEWEQLFKRDPAFIRTDLHQDADNPCRFITVDQWESREACETFRDRFRAEYDAIDERCAIYTVEERHIGDFELRG